ncbi:hypothetical protein NHF45_10695 [Maricaulaceae bacterium NA33B04]|nr:hypothetical protein [Maricaulaceae bacterium NA33B04]
MSDTSKSKSGKAEPVDAEFEPAPSGTDAPKTPKPEHATDDKSGGLPWLTIALVTVFAGAIGGGAGYLMGKYGPDPANAALEDRLTALEAAATEDDVTTLEARLGAVEDQIQGAQLRAEGLEQLVRDVAELRDRIEAIEAAPAGESGSFSGDASAAIDALERQLNDTLSAFRDRLNTLRSDTDTARSIAEQAQSSLQQAMSLLSQAGSNTGGEPSSGGASQAAVSAIEARVASLETALTRLNTQADQLRNLQQTVAGMAEAEPSLPGLDQLQSRVNALEASLASMDDTPPAATAPASASLAERALAFAAVSRAAAGSQPFPVEVANLSRLWPGAPGISALTEPARTGAPTLDQLTATFPGDAIRAATGEAQLLFGIIRVERDGTTGPTPAIEAALEAGDLAAAVTATRALDGEARTVAAPWLARAEARLAMERGLASLADALSRAEETNR